MRASATIHVCPSIVKGWHSCADSLVVLANAWPNPTFPPSHVRRPSGPRNARKSVIVRRRAPSTGAPSRFRIPTKPLICWKAASPDRNQRLPEQVVQERFKVLPQHVGL